VSVPSAAPIATSISLSRTIIQTTPVLVGPDGDADADLPGPSGLAGFISSSEYGH
jgi:hypothetical protein